MVDWHKPAIAARRVAHAAAVEEGDELATVHDVRGAPAAVPSKL